MIKKLKFWQVDSFTSQPFKGNPAAVFVLEQELDDQLMQNIAKEMNLSETAYILLAKDGGAPLLRWFTPTFEIDLCGHATLAAAHILMTEVFPEQKKVLFETKFVGPLGVNKSEKGYSMNFPSRMGEPIDIKELPKQLVQALSPVEPIEAYKSRDLMLVYKDEDAILSMKPNMTALKNVDDFIIVTSESKSSQYDFISRFFCADDGIPEDPVTGSAHCTSGPYWAQKLNKQKLNAYQASERGGELFLEILKDRILIEGEALTIIEGVLKL